MIEDWSDSFLLSGLIDSEVFLGSSGGGTVSPYEVSRERRERDLAADLALGVTTVVSFTDRR